MIQSLSHYAPRILLGAFFLFASCEEESNKSAKSPPEPVPREQVGQDQPQKGAESAPPGGSAPETKPAPAITSGGIRFMAYNVENYLTMDRYIKGGGKKTAPKDPAEIEALVGIIVAEKPDILGICEIGTKDDLADLQSRLKKAGLDLPHTLHTGGFDQTRHLAILSSLPIAANNSKRELVYQINGTDRMMGRGLLDATIELPGGPTRFIGLHLKSKREMKDFDQSEIRLHEARLAREHCEAIMARDPDARIVVYGDFNDTRKTPPLAMLMGKFRSDTYLGDVFVKDSRGELWTHFWSWQQQYSRLDWVLVSPSVFPVVDRDHSYIVDRPSWNDASDHRAIVVTLKE